jgi:hypothetical protein
MNIILHCECCYSFSRPSLFEVIYSIAMEKVVTVCPDCKQEIIRRNMECEARSGQKQEANCCVCKQTKSTITLETEFCKVPMCTHCFNQYLNKKIDKNVEKYLTKIC